MIGEAIGNKERTSSRSLSAEEENASLEKVFKQRRAIEKDLQKILDKYENMVMRDNLKPVAERSTRKILTEMYEKVYEFKKLHPTIWANPKLQVYSSRKSVSKSKSLSSSRSRSNL
jgi:hypothetical protein